jgi:DNA-binding CsgD family transcriptional regulator
MSWDVGAAGFNVLHGTVVVAYAPNYSPLGAFTAGVAPHPMMTTQFLPAPRLVLEGSNYVPPRKRQPGTIAAAAEAIADLVAPDMLSRRQLDVLSLIVQGRSNKEIARTLHLAEGTVKIHVAALFSKLGVHRRAAVAIAGARFLAKAPPQSVTSTRRASDSRSRPAPLRRRSAVGEVVASSDDKPGQLGHLAARGTAIGA